MPTYGILPNGTYSLCRAKIENRGQGRCPHGEHVILTSQQAYEHNEPIIAQAQGGTFTSAQSTIPEINGESVIQASTSGSILNRQELQESAHQLAQQISPEEWKWMQETINILQNQKGSHQADVIFKQLTKDNPEMRRLRGFLNMNQDQLKELSKIITSQVGSMTRAVPWRNGGRVRRAVLTSLDNDMNRDRYMASVLFFGGRCCYCNCVLQKGSDKLSQNGATAEHITPIHPRGKGPIGSTRFGNMALACSRCNSDRGNQELTQWMVETPFIKRKNKARALARIEAFRRFTLYSEFSPQKQKKIEDRINHISQQVSSAKKEAPLTRNQLDEFRDQIKIAIIDLQNSTD